MSANAYIVAFAEPKTSKIEEKHAYTPRFFAILPFANASVIVFDDRIFKNLSIPHLGGGEDNWGGVA